MSPTKKVGSLEIGQDLDFQRKAWMVQRIGWVVMALLLLLTLLGLFSQGPLSRTTAGSVDVPLNVEYDRFARFGRSTDLRLQLQPAAVSGDTAQVWLSQSYLDAVQVEQVSPQPNSVQSAGDRQVYTFQVADPAQPGVVTFHVQPRRAGVLRGQAGIEGGAPIGISQFVYP